jgi:uncharacterized protein YkwD
MLVHLIFFVSVNPARATPTSADSSYDLINAVNSLRASYGLPAYGISSVLMYTAQSQADFMAATGNVTHSGPGGISVTDRLLAAGYPLAGDLSLGGFRSENITGGSESMTAQSAVNQWTGDAPHLNTMISPDLTEIGAGVAVANGRVYYVIDCARPTTGGGFQGATPVGVGVTTVPVGEAAIPVVIISTPNQNGEVVHEVLAGQTLWQIAIAYDVKINDIKSLNNLTGDNIFPGEKLLIKKVEETASETPFETSTAVPTTSPTLFATPSLVQLTATMASTLNPDTQASNSNIASITIGIIALAILAGGFLAWRGAAAKG